MATWCVRVRVYVCECVHSCACICVGVLGLRRDLLLELLCFNVGLHKRWDDVRIRWMYDTMYLLLATMIIIN